MLSRSWALPAQACSRKAARASAEPFSSAWRKMESSFMAMSAQSRISQRLCISMRRWRLGSLTLSEIGHHYGSCAVVARLASEKLAEIQKSDYAPAETVRLDKVGPRIGLRCIRVALAGRMARLAAGCALVFRSNKLHLRWRRWT